MLASGRGTDFQAISDHIKLDVLQNARIQGLVCNHRGAKVIERARLNDIEVFEIEGPSGKKFASREEREHARAIFDRNCLEVFNSLMIDLVILAGFDQIVSKEFVEACRFRILNIHPAYDLSQFGGKNMVGLKVHEAVIKSGAKFSGCTVHYVTSDVDLGPPILKKRIDLDDGESAESLEAKVLALEHITYPEAIQLLADERAVINKEGTMCFVDRFSGNWDVNWSTRQRKYLVTHPDESQILCWKREAN